MNGCRAPAEKTRYGKIQPAHDPVPAYLSPWGGCKLKPEISVEVSEEHHIAGARQVCRILAAEIGFSSVEICYVETSVSELAGNLYFHTDRGGTITFSRIESMGGMGIEVISEDEGPGIEDVSLAMQDGYSTNGGLGSGLPGVERLMDEFELMSQRGWGTRVVARKWKRRR